MSAPLWDDTVEVPPHLCPACFGWGFAFFPWKDRVSYNPGTPCPECGGTGKPKPVETNGEKP